MRTIIDICDRCKKTNENDVDLKLKTVGIGVKEVANYYYLHPALYYRDNKKREMDMCESCRIELCIEPIKKDNPALPAKVTPSLEDIVREIMRDEIKAATGARI